MPARLSSKRESTEIQNAAPGCFWAPSPHFPLVRPRLTSTSAFDRTSPPPAAGVLYGSQHNSLSLSLHSPVRDVWVLVSQTTLHTSPDATVGSSARCVSLVPVSRVLQVSALASVCHATRHPPPPPSQRPPHPNMSLLHPSIRESCAFLPSAPATLSHLLHHTRAHSPSAPILKPLTNPAPRSLARCHRSGRHQYPTSCLGRTLWRPGVRSAPIRPCPLPPPLPQPWQRQRQPLPPCRALRTCARSACPLCMRDRSCSPAPGASSCEQARPQPCATCHLPGSCACERPTGRRGRRQTAWRRAPSLAEAGAPHSIHPCLCCLSVSRPEARPVVKHHRASETPGQ